jgi:hypothetical protein
MNREFFQRALAELYNAICPSNIVRVLGVSFVGALASPETVAMKSRLVLRRTCD